MVHVGMVSGFLAYGWLVLAGAGTADSAGRLERQTIDFAPGETLELRTNKGTIQLIPTETGGLAIEARIQAPRSIRDLDYAREIVDRARVVVERTETGVRIKSEQRDVDTPEGTSEEKREPNLRTVPEVHYVIRAPRELKLDLSDHKSSFAAEGFRGDFRLRSHKGSIALNAFHGRVDLETHQGIAELHGFRGSLTLKTHQGEATVEAREIDGDSSLETYKGTVRLEIPATQEANIRTHIAAYGELESEFPIDFGEGVESVLGRGGPTIRLKTPRGKISLARFEDDGSVR